MERVETLVAGAGVSGLAGGCARWTYCSIEDDILDARRVVEGASK
jgi:hypothetical protein